MRMLRLREAVWGLVILGFVAYLATPAISQWAAITTNSISVADTSKPLTINGGTLGTKLGNSTTAGTAVTQLVRYSQTLNPTADTSNASIPYFTTFNQTFTVTGLALTDRVFVNGPAPTALCPMSSWRVSAANTLQITYTKQTTATCTPATGIYDIWALRG